MDPKAGDIMAREQGEVQAFVRISFPIRFVSRRIPSPFPHVDSFRENLRPQDRTTVYA